MKHGFIITCFSLFSHKKIPAVQFSGSEEVIIQTEVNFQAKAQWCYKNSIEKLEEYYNRYRSDGRGGSRTLEMIDRIRKIFVIWR